MKKIWCSFPVVQCPHCGESFQVDDYYDLKKGDSITCHECEKEVYILMTETIIECELGTKID